MAPKKRSPARRPAPPVAARAPRVPRAKVQRAIAQAREPLSLLQTLREEGLGNALTLLSVAGTFASGAARNLRTEALLPQLRELLGSLGFATREELERLQARVDELEQRESEREYAALRASEEE